MTFSQAMVHAVRDREHELERLTYRELEALTGHRVSHTRESKGGAVYEVLDYEFGDDAVDYATLDADDCAAYYGWK